MIVELEGGNGTCLTKKKPAESGALRGFYNNKGPDLIPKLATHD